MSWYTHMFKSQEAARERNRREQRRLEMDITEKHGIQFEARYRIEEVTQRQRLVEKELERIRQGIHRKPAHPEPPSNSIQGNQGNQGNQGKLDDGANQGTQSQSVPILSTLSSRQGHRYPLTFSPAIQGSGAKYSGSPRNDFKPTALIDAIVYLQNNPAAIEKIKNASPRNETQAINPSNSRGPVQQKSMHPSEEVRSPRKLQDSQEKFVPAYLLQKTLPEKLSKYTPLLRSLSPVMVKKTVTAEVNQGQEPRDGQTDSGFVYTDSGPSTSRSTRKPSDFLTFATSPGDPGQPARGAMAKRSSKDPAIPAAITEEATEKGREKRPGATKALFPEANPDNYNPDGSLRTELQIESFDKRWEEAQKARYIRTKETLERDRELEVNEIFAKDN